MVDKLTLEDLRALAARADIRLDDEELLRLLPGVHRSRQQVVKLRRLIDPRDEPAATFKAARTE